MKQTNQPNKQKKPHNKNQRENYNHYERWLISLPSSVGASVPFQMQQHKYSCHSKGVVSEWQWFTWKRKFRALADFHLVNFTWTTSIGALCELQSAGRSLFHSLWPDQELGNPCVKDSTTVVSLLAWERSKIYGIGHLPINGLWEYSAPKNEFSISKKESICASTPTVLSEKNIWCKLCTIF